MTATGALTTTTHPAAHRDAVPYPEKTLAVDEPPGEIASLAVVVSGLAIVVGTTGWQVAWLIAVALVLGLRRHGRRIAASLGPPRVPHGPDGL